MRLADLQRHAVDAIKRHALVLSLASRRAQARILTEYLWTEEGAESSALAKTRDASPPPWVDKLLANQLADERRHAVLLREQLRALGAETDRPPPSLASVKLWWLERACAPYYPAFSAGPIVVLLAVAAQFEGTGVRVFGRHVGVLEAHERATGTLDPIATALRSILADEQRHARSCAAALDRLVTDDERPVLAELRAHVARIDRSFGVTLALGFWLLTAGQALRDRAALRPARSAS